jgi:hypothetical protein
MMIKTTLLKRNLKKYNWGKLGLELLVVFLGVTSGFLLNNWREQQKEDQLEQKYISGFLSDVNENIEQLEELNGLDSLWLIQARENVLAIQNNTLNRDSAEAMMKKIVVINKMEPHEVTYEDIKNSGNLNLIQNFKLKSKIVDYQITLKGVRFLDYYFYEYFNDFVMPFVFSEFNVLTGHFKNDDSFKTIQFSNVFVGYYSMVQQRNFVYKDLLSESKEFKTILLDSKK